MEYSLKWANVWKDLIEKLAAVEKRLVQLELMNESTALTEKALALKNQAEDAEAKSKTEDGSGKVSNTNSNCSFWCSHWLTVA